MTGMVMISEYASELYNDMLRGRKKTEKGSRINAGCGTKVRTECLWVNEACAFQNGDTIG